MDRHTNEGPNITTIAALIVSTHTVVVTLIAPVPPNASTPAPPPTEVLTARDLIIRWGAVIVTVAGVLLAVIAAVLLVAAWRSWRDRPEERHLTVLGVVILLVPAVHSFVDYPLRSMALACLIGTGAGLLISTLRLRPAYGPNT